MSVTPANGYDALNALPPPHRGLVLIDPPYQTRDDCPKAIAPLNEGLTRFATGTLTVQPPSADDVGMHGSGMFIINPPRTLHQTLADIMPYLVEMLGQDSRWMHRVTEPIHRLLVFAHPLQTKWLYDSWSFTNLSMK